MKDSLSKESAKAKKHFDRKTRMRELQPGDLCLILLPTAESKLLMQWKGPYQVTERVGPTDYRIRVGNMEKIYHINMLKKYYEVSSAKQNQEKNEHIEEAAAAILQEEDDDSDKMVLPVVADIPTLKGETVADVNVNDKLSPEQQQQLRSLLQEYEDIFSDCPGTTSQIEHRIQLLDDNPVRCKAYPVPHAVIDLSLIHISEPTRPY